MRVITVLCVNMVTANILLSALFASGAPDCPDDADLSITAPQEMEALNGSCLQIPCTFRPRAGQEFDKSSKQIIGIWIKNHYNFDSANIIFNSDQTVNTYPMNITGNLSEKNCTTLFSSLITRYTDKYFLRIVNKPFMSTAVCDPLQITVKDSAPSPRIEISAGDLKENQSVTITCSAVTPCPHSPPELTWNLQPDAHNKIEENTDRTLTTKIQETITLSEQHDGFNISCSVRYPVNEGKAVKTATAWRTLSVSYSPRDTSVVISPSDPVSVGSVMNLTCSCSGSPPVEHFVWFMISDGRLEMIRVDTQVYVFTVTNSDRGRSFFCGCRNAVDIQLSTGRQLIFEGDQQSEQVDVQVVVKTLGIIMLVSALLIFECWVRSRHSTKAVKDTEKAVYVNTVTELSP